MVLTAESMIEGYHTLVPYNYYLSLLQTVWVPLKLIPVLFLGGGGGYTCYGDMMRLSPTGASAATARQDRLGYTGKL